MERHLIQNRTLLRYMRMLAVIMQGICAMWRARGWNAGGPMLR